ncbi:hypothetical protein D5086_002289 [Populus alba]|uniref:Uncharacterized protein n=1 Tax=Populus alba TaxID=43335 RepID=A0ACC4D1Z1_POPAL
MTRVLMSLLRQKPVVGGIGLGSTVKIDFCSSCSYRGNAVTMKRMLETQFPGIDVVLANYPPSLPKRAVAKLVPVFQIGVVGIVLGGEQIFPMLGVRTPPWYYSLRANKFGTIASTWLLGNALQSFLQSSGAFEVYCDDELVFSKLREGRFPGEIELKDIVGRSTCPRSFILEQVTLYGSRLPSLFECESGLSSESYNIYRDVINLLPVIIQGLLLIESRGSRKRRDGDLKT